MLQDNPLMGWNPKVNIVIQQGLFGRRKGIKQGPWPASFENFLQELDGRSSELCIHHQGIFKDDAQEFLSKVLVSRGDSTLPVPKENNLQVFN